MAGSFGRESPAAHGSSGPARKNRLAVFSSRLSSYIVKHRRSRELENDRFDQGWDAAIAEVRKHVEQYVASKQAGNPVDPWEEWLPRLLDLLAQ